MQKNVAEYTKKDNIKDHKNKINISEDSNL